VSRRAATTTLAIAVGLFGCAVPVPSPPGLPGVSIRNQDSGAVTVRWSGPGVRGERVVDACDTFDLGLTAGQYVLELRSRADQASLPVAVDPADAGIGTVIGISASGEIRLGNPRPNPSCANT
jgi:hypothetical protein